MNFIYEKYKNELSFDITKLNQLVQLGYDLNEDVVSQLLQVHFETSENSLHEIKTWFEKQNYLQIRKATHKLKSSCGTLGLNKLHSLCNDLENYLSQAQPVGRVIVKVYLDCIDFEYDQTKKEIQQFNQTEVGA